VKFFLEIANSVDRTLCQPSCTSIIHSQKYSNHSAFIKCKKHHYQTGWGSTRFAEENNRYSH
jgi:hypothetical protein